MARVVRRHDITRQHGPWKNELLFAGSDAGGEALANAMSVIKTANLHGLNPEAYLADILGRIKDHKINALDELLPWKWQPVGSVNAA